MAQHRAPTGASTPAGAASVGGLAALLVAWGIVAIPLAWGVYQTVIKSMALLQ